MAKPIFVVGYRRSGTTWLGNIISQHNNVASVQSSSLITWDVGVYESVYFARLAGKFGDLKYHNNLIHFIEFFGNSDYFEMSGLDKELLYRERPTTYEGLFRLVMDRLAEKNGNDFWIEKTPSHAFHLEEISGYYDDAKFIAIKRNIVEQLRSAMKISKLAYDKGSELRGIKRKLILVKELLAYCGSYKHIERFKRESPDKIMIIAYENLVRSTPETVVDICDFLGLDFQQQMLESRKKKYTSFKSTDERNLELSTVEVKMIQVLGYCISALPFIFHRFVYVTRRKSKWLYLPYYYFSNKIKKYEWKDLYLTENHENPEKD